MATAQHSLQFLQEAQQGEHNVLSHALVVVLLTSSFSFDPVTHATYDDISSYELPEGNGYSQKSKVLTVNGVNIDATNKRVVVDCTNPSWEVSGEAWTDLQYAAVINDTHANDTVVTCINFETIYSLDPGTPFQVDFAAVGGLYAANAIVSTSA